MRVEVVIRGMGRSFQSASLLISGVLERTGLLERGRGSRRGAEDAEPEATEPNEKTEGIGGQDQPSGWAAARGIGEPAAAREGVE